MDILKDMTKDLCNIVCYIDDSLKTKKKFYDKNVLYIAHQALYVSACTRYLKEM